MKAFWCGLLIFSFVLGAVSIASAQPGRGPGGFGGFDSTLFLLRDESIRKELEIVPEQQEKLEALGEKMRDEMRDMFSGLRDLPEDERRERFEELREKMADAQEKMQDDVNDILLPQQKDRLAQIRFQSQMRRSGGGTGGLTSRAVVEALDISEEQLEQMREKEEEVREELAEKIREATEDARKELLGVLSKEQQKKYEELMGQPFEFQNRGFGGFQGRQGRGGRDRGGNDSGRPQRPQT